ncbi:MAG: hypothetical protein ACOCZB_08985 [Spirochaetota bacterium]
MNQTDHMNQTDRTIKSALETAVAETFTEMAFLDAIPAEAPVENAESQVFAIEIRGDEPQRLVLDLPLDTKQSIVENIHARPWDELSSSEIDDCLLEFLNVLGGNYGRIYWGDESRYRLSFPEVRIAIRDDLDAEDVQSYWFDAYGQLFAVHVAPER